MIVGSVLVCWPCKDKKASSLIYTRIYMYKCTCWDISYCRAAKLSTSGIRVWDVFIWGVRFGVTNRKSLNANLGGLQRTMVLLGLCQQLLNYLNLCTCMWLSTVLVGSKLTCPTPRRLLLQMGIEHTHTNARTQIVHNRARRVEVLTGNSLTHMCALFACQRSLNSLKGQRLDVESFDMQSLMWDRVLF